MGKKRSRLADVIGRREGGVMSYDKDFGFTCSNCDENIGGEMDMMDFDESLEYKEEEGWINRKIEGIWHNFCCNECYEKFVQD